LNSNSLLKEAILALTKQDLFAKHCPFLRQQSHACSESLFDAREIKEDPPPKAFLDQGLAANRAWGVRHCVIDVDLQKEWCVVKVNPPYALMSYGWRIEAYYSLRCSAQRSQAL